MTQKVDYDLNYKTGVKLTAVYLLLKVSTKYTNNNITENDNSVLAF